MHVAVLDAGCGRYKLVALRRMKKNKPYLAGIGAWVFQGMSGGGFESMSYGPGAASDDTRGILGARGGAARVSNASERGNRRAVRDAPVGGRDELFGREHMASAAALGAV